MSARTAVVVGFAWGCIVGAGIIMWIDAGEFSKDVAVMRENMAVMADFRRFWKGDHERLQRYASIISRQDAMIDSLVAEHEKCRVARLSLRHPH